VIRPPLFSETARRHGIDCRFCDGPVGSRRYSGRVLALDFSPALLSEWLPRAVVETATDADWPLLLLETGRFDAVFVGRWWPLPVEDAVVVLAAGGVLVDCRSGRCLYR
jgi:hypothetical protein